MAGGVLIVVGLHILFANLDSVAGQYLTGTGETPWVVPSAILATAQAVQAYGSDHQGVSGLLRVLVSFWPLLLVTVGTMFLREFLREAFTDKVEALPAPVKYFQN